MTPDDIKAIVAPVCSHRMALTPDAELRGLRIDAVLAELVESIPVPRSREG